MVAEQRETVQRIDADTIDIQNNVSGAQRELLKYYASISSNRWLMLKVFGVIIVFVSSFLASFAGATRLIGVASSLCSSWFHRLAVQPAFITYSMHLCSCLLLIIPDIARIYIQHFTTRSSARALIRDRRDPALIMCKREAQHK